MSRSTRHPSRTFCSAAAAYKFLERQFGPPGHEFLYVDADDEPVGVVLLWDDGDDDRRETISRWKHRWVIEEISPPRPLFQLSSLADAQRVYLLPTEMEAERMGDFGLTATCCVAAGGSPAAVTGEPPVTTHETGEPPASTVASTAAMTVDWRPLAGKEVILLPRANEAGEAWAAAIGQFLADPLSELKCTVRILRLPDMPPQGDLIDWLGYEFGIERLQRMQAGEENIDPDEIEEHLAATGRKIDALADDAAWGRSGDLPEDDSGDAAAIASGEEEDQDQDYDEDEDYEEEDVDSGRSPDLRHGAVVQSAAELDSGEVDWLWPGRIALGKLTLLAGDPGVGKSLLTLNIAARVTAGWAWPDVEAGCQPASVTGEPPVTTGDVILLSAEDDPRDTIGPRLRAAGAFMERVHIVTHVWGKPDTHGRRQAYRLSLGHDITALVEVILSRKNCRLVIIDPITAFLGGADQHRHGAMMGLLGNLAELAKVTGVAVLAVSHLNKRTGSAAIYRTIGSLAFTAVARSVWLLTKDATDPAGARRLLSAAKNNLGSDQNSLAFSIICPPPCTQPLLEWHGTPQATDADRATHRRDVSPGERAADGEAIQWLTEMLARGPVAAKEVRSRAREDGISRRPLLNAKAILSVSSRRISTGNAGEGLWSWEMEDAAVE